LDGLYIQHQTAQHQQIVLLARCDHFKLALCLELEGNEDRFAVFDAVIDFVLEGRAESSHMS
jgi:hypothetical protein